MLLPVERGLLEGKVRSWLLTCAARVLALGALWGEQPQGRVCKVEEMTCLSRGDRERKRLGNRKRQEKAVACSVLILKGA